MRTAAAVLSVLTLALSIGVARQPAATPKFPPVILGAPRAGPTLDGLAGPLWAVAVAGDGCALLAAGEDGTIRCWTQDVTFGIRSGEGSAEALAAHRGPVLAIASANGTTASGGADGKVIVWHTAEGRIARELHTPGPARAIALTHDGRTLACAGEQSSLQLWDTATGERKNQLKDAGDWILAVAFSPDGNLVAAGWTDGRVRLWEASTGQKRYDVDARPSPAPDTPINSVSSIAFSPDGKLLAVGGSESAIHLLQPGDGKVLRSLVGHTGTVTALAFHPGGELLASASKDRSVRLWNPVTGQLLKTLDGHGAWVQGVTFFARGTRLASASADGTVRLWDLTDPSKK
jgi:WD40 repeat protein